MTRFKGLLLFYTFLFTFNPFLCNSKDSQTLDQTNQKVEQVDKEFFDEITTKSLRKG